MNAIKRWFTIWEFKGVTIPQTVVVAKCMEPREYEHEYQRVLSRIEAYTEVEALARFKHGEGK